MTKYILDVHTHSIVSGHAYGTIREMAKEASNKNLLLLGISDHAPGIPGTCEPFHFLNFQVVPKKLYNVCILHGSEVNVLNDGTLSLDEVYLNGLDYAIVGIHTQCYDNQGIEKNTDNLIQCMKHDNVFFVSHPDDDHTPLNYERLVLAAQKYHIALEVNNSSLIKEKSRLNCRENYRNMLKLCQIHKVPVLFSSDAHDPSAVGDFSMIIDFMKDIDFDDSLIINTDINKFKKFINYKF